MKARQADVAAQRRFASELLRQMQQRDRRATVLQMQEGPGMRTRVLGLVDEGQWVPLLRLGAQSAACNVMSVFVPQRGRWMPTFVRGTPVELAEQLTGPFAYLWSLAATMVDYSPAP